MATRLARPLILLVLLISVSAKADDPEFLLECRSEGEIAFHVEFYPANVVKLILASGAADGVVYTSENFYRLEIPATNSGPEFLITINRLSKVFTYEAGRAPFGSNTKDNVHMTGKCVKADRKNLL